MVLSDAGKQQVLKLCEVLKGFLTERRKQWLRRHAGMPILEAYACDGNPLKTISRHTWGIDHLTSTRCGTSSSDWVMQRLFLSAGPGDANVLYSEPRQLSDKSAWAHFEVQRQLSSMARQHHDGIVVSHHCWDRALKTSCEKLAVGATMRTTPCSAAHWMRGLRRSRSLLRG